MRTQRPGVPAETRAEIARRRLARLAESFEARIPPEEPVDEVAPARRLDARHVRVVVTIAVAAGVLLVWWMLAGRPETTVAGPPLALGSPTASDSAAPPTTGAPAPTELVVDVAGKVRRPGIVTVPAGARVFEAIEAAGGLDGAVDTTALNLARPLSDGEQVLVGIEPVVVEGAAPAVGAKVNLNTATAEQLDALPGVGPVTAQAILGWRDENGPFHNVEDLLDVKGIGDATFAELHDLVTV